MTATRFAPSPTGLMHIGHAYAALFARDAAARAGGRFLVRIEDIDRARARPEFEAAIFEDLAWLGLAWEEPVLRQSECFARYRELVESLEEAGVAFRCFRTRKQIAALVDPDLNAPHGPDGPAFFSPDKDLSRAQVEERVAQGAPFAIRLDARKAARLVGPLTFTDRARGTIPVDPLAAGDVVLARKDAPASYALAVVADDALQGIDLVTRAEDLLAATHIQRVLQTLLGLPEPAYHHHTLLTDAAGKRFAKRDRSATLRHLRETGTDPAVLRARLLAS